MVRRLASGPSQRKVVRVLASRIFQKCRKLCPLVKSTLNCPPILVVRPEASPQDISELYPVQGIYNPVRKSMLIREEWRAKQKSWLFISMKILSVAQKLKRTRSQGDLLGFGSHLYHIPIMWPRARCFILLNISCLTYKTGSIGFDPWVKCDGHITHLLPALTDKLPLKMYVTIC